MFGPGLLLSKLVATILNELSRSAAAGASSIGNLTIKTDSLHRMSRSLIYAKTLFLQRNALVAETQPRMHRSELRVCLPYFPCHGLGIGRLSR